MGEVFRGVHRERNFPVALKIMNAERAQHPEFRHALRQEIRAVARLYHPGVIMVFDSGEVPEALEHETKGRYVADSSWFAMELASYSLEDLDRSTLDWWHVRNIFVRILDALSHSHARGVIHRDLKPGNVLFVQGPDGRQLKLTDFGLAHALDETPAQESLGQKITGTPRFMSPEQITGQWRDHGPWTDLYALGCMAYWLVDGQPPHRGDSTDEILESHLDNPLPPLHAPFDVPREFGAWLGRLLAKNPADRFQRSADAARALFKLGDPPGQSRPDDHPRLSFHNSLDEQVTPDLSDTDMGMTEIISDVLASPSVPELQALERPRYTPTHQDAPEHFKIPQSWHRRQPPPLSTELIGVGLGLFGLREIPFVDRDDERDQIWAALRRVGRTSSPHIVFLKGATGTGKSRLAAWTCERAHEVGAATPLRASHGPMGGAHEGLAAMFANHLRCSELDREDILERIRHSLHDRSLDPDALHDCLAMSEIVAPAVLDDYREENARIRFHTPEERHAVIFRFLKRLGRRRPIILLLDDLQWGNETLNTLEYLVETVDTRRLPLLVIGTVQTDALVDRPVAREKIEHLSQDSHTETVSVGSLPPDEHRLLINRMLGLEKDLVEQVAERTGGNPLYAVQLVDDWVERGVLELGSTGFRLREGEEAPLPADLQELFRDRLATLVRQDLDAPAGNALQALELAAALGTDVKRVEWSTVCKQCAVQLPLLVLDSMVANDLATLMDGGWSFTHQAFRDTLLHNAETQGRLEGHHLQCAKALRQLYPEQHPGLPRRLGRHLLKANRPADALQPVLNAGAQCRIRCDFELEEAFYREYEELLGELDVPANDRRRALGLIERAKSKIRREELSAADELLERAERMARIVGDRDLLADTLLQRAIVANDCGHLPDGMRIIKEAHKLYEELGDTNGRAQAYLTLADLHYWAGDYHDAEKAYRKAQRLFDRIDQPLDLARVEKALGSLYTSLEDTERAQEIFQDARQVFEEHGDLTEVAYCLNNLGETYRLEQRLGEAEEAYQEALDILSRIGIGDDAIIMMNLGMVRLAQNRVEDADPLFRRVLELLAGSQRRGYIGLAHLARLPATAHHRQWKQWDFHLAEARHLLTATGLVDADLARLARDAGERALKADEIDRAREALLLARTQWLSMGRQDQAAAIDRIMPPQ